MKIESMDAALQNTAKPVAQSEINVKIAQTESQSATQHGESELGNEYKVSKEFIQKVADKANYMMARHNSTVEFKVHEKTHDIIIKVIDSKTKEVIKEIPSEKILDMFASMLEQAGLLVDERR